MPNKTITADMKNNWQGEPGEMLHNHKNGTMFLLRKEGRIHLCELWGNITGDQSCKARRFSDGKIIRLERQHRSEYVLINEKAEKIIRIGL